MTDETGRSLIRRSARPKRKGRDGCYVCGEPTEVVVQVWMREFTGERDKGNNRRMRSVKSISVSFCRTHGTEFYDRHTAEIPSCKPEPMQGGDLAQARAKSDNSGWGSNA